MNLRISAVNPDLAAAALAKQFWTLGNLIAGFCVLQDLAYLAVTYAAGDQTYARALSAPYFASAAVSLGTVTFSGCAWLCGRKEMTLRRAANHPFIVLSSARQITVGRIICIMVFYCIGGSAAASHSLASPAKRLRFAGRQSGKSC